MIVTPYSPANAQNSSGPERAIRHPEEDKLNRDAFVRRLFSAVISERTGRATGVTVGITGPWGCGKSSVLNLLHKYITDKCRDAIVVRFDPWLVTGRDGLITEFITEVIRTINSTDAHVDKRREIVRRLAEYGEVLSPAANLMVPGIGAVVGSGFGAVQKALAQDQSLFARREQLQRALDELSQPLVVLIDELDRVEDREIRTMAQLIRAVVDFPTVSYVVAYDADRVAQALGIGDTSHERRAHGRAYLEKIIQFQIPLPVSLPDETVSLFESELLALEGEIPFPTQWRDLERFKKLKAILIPGVLNTPRDLKRTIGTFHVLEGMVRGEVDWIGLLGLCALQAKAPETAEAIRRNPDSVVIDPELAGYFRRRREGKTPADQRLATFVPKHELTEGIRELMCFLFPIFATDGNREPFPDDVCLRRPLLTALRLSLLPNTFSREYITDLLRQPSHKIMGRLQDAETNANLGTLIDRLIDVYPDVSEVNHDEIWKALSQFLEKADEGWETFYNPRRNLNETFANFFMSLPVKDPNFRAQAGNILENMISRNELTLTSHLLRDHIFAHGIFGYEARGDQKAVLDAAATETTIRQLAEQHRSDLLSGKLAPRLRDLCPVFNMMDAGMWNAECKEYMQKLAEDFRFLDNLMLWLYGGHFVTESNTIEVIIGVEYLIGRLKQRTDQADFESAHETVQLAYRKRAARSI